MEGKKNYFPVFFIKVLTMDKEEWENYGDFSHPMFFHSSSLNHNYFPYKLCPFIHTRRNTEHTKNPKQIKLTYMNCFKSLSDTQFYYQSVRTKYLSIGQN